MPNHYWYVLTIRNKIKTGFEAMPMNVPTVTCTNSLKIKSYKVGVSRFFFSYNDNTWPAAD